MHVVEYVKQNGTNQKNIIEKKKEYTNHGMKMANYIHNAIIKMEY